MPFLISAYFLPPYKQFKDEKQHFAFELLTTLNIYIYFLPAKHTGLVCKLYHHKKQ